MAVFDLHVHTVRGSSDSSLTPEQLVEAAQKAGLDGVCLTEHSGGWDDAELKRAFRAADIAVIGGLEVATDLGHVLVIGLHSYVAAGLLDARELSAVVRRAGGVLIAAHPFRNVFNGLPYGTGPVFKDPSGPPPTVAGAAGHPLFAMVDAIEVANGANTDQENRFCLEVARHLRMAGTGGSDAHSIQGLGRYVTVFDGEVRSESALIEGIRSGAFHAAAGVAPFATPALGPQE